MPAAPLAGRPPFATDEPDTIYETSPSPARRRVGPAKSDNPNKRSSAYDVYDNYLTDDNNNSSTSKNPFASPPRNGQAASNLRPPRSGSPKDPASSRNSGIGGIGMGLLNMDYSDSEDDSDDDFARKPAQTKNAALAAAVSGKPTTNNPFASPNNSQHNLHQPQMQQQNRSPPPIAAPQPGYAAPIAALQNTGSMSGSPPRGGPGMPAPVGFPNPNGAPRQQMRQGPPNGLSLNTSAANVGLGPSMPAPAHVGMGGVGIRHMSPAPLDAPATPIMPVFVAIPKENKEPAIKFDDSVSAARPRPPKEIMRGNNEETMLPRRGEKGDDFWRRFSMIAKDEGNKKESSWLHKTRNGKSRLSRWVWLIGIVLLLLIGGGVGLGIYVTRNNAEHQEPTILFSGSTVSKAVATFTPGAVGGARGGGTPVNGLDTPANTGANDGRTGTRAIFHVSPTHTIDSRDVKMRREVRREVVAPVVGAVARDVPAIAPLATPAPAPVGKRHLRRRL
ncbi:hypothetical protein FA15DRAFT_250530 [Coprinopsis marcescibilis]|uniref:Uncharacterized protein n=1 Tax=Coprinopsis marcescibilis TaxID=230819 RepID=A0A5C3L2N8_COPMA|nr:hypothetical protein FA15DRAFT_250530 [Coprinopsis marcescibilis]